MLYIQSFSCCTFRLGCEEINNQTLAVVFTASVTIQVASFCSVRNRHNTHYFASKTLSTDVTHTNQVSLLLLYRIISEAKSTQAYIIVFSAGAYSHHTSGWELTITSHSSGVYSDHISGWELTMASHSSGVYSHHISGWELTMASHSSGVYSHHHNGEELAMEGHIGHSDIKHG